MSEFKLNKNVKKILENAGRKKANELAEDAKSKLIEQYNILIDFYYADYMPKLDNNGIPYYIRTFNLYRSYRPYKRNSHNTIYYGGIEIESSKMRNYRSIKGETFYASSLLYKFIYNENGTWHGGDWHGGYGEINSFNIYKEMIKYRDNLINKYSGK